MDDPLIARNDIQLSEDFRNSARNQNCNQQQMSTEIKDLKMKLHNSNAKFPRDTLQSILRSELTDFDKMELYAPFCAGSPILFCFR